ncbi:GNAT family N-acetyltransferase [Lacicoccus qingdaonensis]|nr:GNAT family N-acetyltransferase [Salinicoccus qingdaonensis]
MDDYIMEQYVIIMWKPSIRKAGHMEFRKADETEMHEVSQLLAGAFKDYPLFEIIEKNNHKRYRLIRALQHLNTKVFLKKHTCLVAVEDNEILAAALVKNLQNKNNDMPDYIKIGGLPLLFKGLLPKTLQFLKLANSSEVNIEDSKRFDWYVDSFAVSHKTQGKGVGSRLLKECVFPYIAKNDGGIVSLVTNTGINRKFYMKNGFEEFKEENLKLKNESVKNWSYRMHIESTLN